MDLLTQTLRLVSVPKATSKFIEESRFSDIWFLLLFIMKEIQVCEIRLGANKKISRFFFWRMMLQLLWGAKANSF